MSAACLSSSQDTYCRVVFIAAVATAKCGNAVVQDFTTASI